MASEKSLLEKQEVINEIKGYLQNAKSVVFVDYRGLSVSEVTELRSKLTEAGVSFKVYKNTLTNIALKDNGVTGMEEFLTGPNAMAFGDDSVMPAKILYSFAKEHEALEIKVGLIDGELYEVAKVKELAMLPSREELLTMLAGGMIQVLKDLTVGLNMLTEKLGEDAPAEGEEVSVENAEAVATENVSEENNEN